MRALRLFAGLVLASLLLAACAVVPTAVPEPAVTPTPNDAPIQPPVAAVAAQRALAELLGVSVEDVVVAKIEEMEWSDSCLGLGGPAESCLMAITPGFRVTLTADGQEYIYRTDRNGTSVRAETGGTSGEPGGEVVAGEVVRDLLARRLGVSLSEVEVVSAEAVEFSDACLGYGSPVELCAAVVTPGYRVIVEQGGAQYEFHTDQEILRIRNQGGNEVFTSLPPHVPQEIAGMLGVEPGAVYVIDTEQVDWKDECFEVLPPNRVCTQAITPGWRVMVEVEGKSYEFRSNMGGTNIIQYEGGSGLGGDDALVWQIEGETCREARINPGKLAYGICNTSPAGEVDLNDELAKELDYLLARFAAFQAHTLVGTVMFNGQGSEQATLAQQRAIAEWARLARATAEFTSGGVRIEPVLVWNRDGGFAGFCDSLVLDASGFARTKSCKSPTGAVYRPVMIESDKLQTLFDWVETYAPFKFEQKDAATADAMTIVLTFEGRGRQVVTEAWKATAQAFAADVFAAAQKPAE